MVEAEAASENTLPASDQDRSWDSSSKPQDNQVPSALAQWPNPSAGSPPASPLANSKRRCRSNAFQNRRPASDMTEPQPATNPAPIPQAVPDAECRRPTPASLPLATTSKREPDHPEHPRAQGSHENSHRTSLTEQRCASLVQRNPMPGELHVGKISGLADSRHGDKFAPDNLDPDLAIGRRCARD